MLKILYAAGNRASSFYSLKRFLDSYDKFYDIKVAGYSKSIGNLNANWNLDALLDFTGKRNGFTQNNSNFALYVREVKRASPNLILSDMEVYSSYIGLDLGIPVWQVSPMLLYYATQDTSNIYKYYSGLLKTNPEHKQYTNYILGNSDKKLVLSHLGDIENTPCLDAGYQWVRPNYKELNIIDGSSVPGTAINFADAYFNGLRTVPIIDYTDPESIITSQLNCKYNLSYSTQKESPLFDVTINSDIKFLSQYLKEVDI